jgi:hypothetical protein
LNLGVFAGQADHRRRIRRHEFEAEMEVKNMAETVSATPLPPVAYESPTLVDVADLAAALPPGCNCSTGGSAVMDW